jgi:hypothetical protein
MVGEEDIKQALNAHCVRPLAIPNPHGPFGLEELAEAVARLNEPSEPLSNELSTKSD